MFILNLKCTLNIERFWVFRTFLFILWCNFQFIFALKGILNSSSVISLGSLTFKDSLLVLCKRNFKAWFLIFHESYEQVTIFFFPNTQPFSQKSAIVLSRVPLAKWLSVRLWTKWLWVSVQLQSICVFCYCSYIIPF